MLRCDHHSDLQGPSCFRTTCWTEILKAGETSHEGQKAFASLYLDYWRPLYGYVRHRGFSHEEAEEVTQDFFVSLIQKQGLAGLQREGGRFRSYLLTSMKNFLANLWDRKQALKRGGGVAPISLEDTGIEERIPARGEAAAELSYDREWARLVLDRALAALEKEFSSGHKEKVFAALRPQLQGDTEKRRYEGIAAELGISEGAVKVAVHRMRQRYGQLLREEIARTVGSVADVQEELRHLLRVVSR